MIGILLNAIEASPEIIKMHRHKRGNENAVFIKSHLMPIISLNTSITIPCIRYIPKLYFDIILHTFMNLELKLVNRSFARQNTKMLSNKIPRVRFP